MWHKHTQTVSSTCLYRQNNPLILHANLTFEIQKHSEGQHLADWREGREPHTRTKDKDRASFQLATQQRLQWGTACHTREVGKKHEVEIMDLFVVCVRACMFVHACACMEDTKKYQLHNHYRKFHVLTMNRDKLWLPLWFCASQQIAPSSVENKVQSQCFLLSLLTSFVAFYVLLWPCFSSYHNNKFIYGHVNRYSLKLIWTGSESSPGHEAKLWGSSAGIFFWLSFEATGSSYSIAN